MSGDNSVYIDIPEATDTLFTPSNRHAILVGYRPDYTSQTSFLTRQNHRVYMLEALLSGGIAAGPNGPIDFRQSEYDIWITPEIEAYEKRRTGIPYDSISRFLPGDFQKNGIETAIDNVAGVANNGTFIFVFITTEGVEGKFGLDYGQTMSYIELLQQLDEVKGKKMIAMLACHSGSIADCLDESTRSDYVILASSRESELSWNWGEDTLYDHHLFPLIKSIGKVSELEIPCTVNANVLPHHPLFIRPFDVRL